MIARATLADIPAINKLVNAAYRGDSSRKGWTTEADLLDGTRTDEKALKKFFEDPSSIILKYQREDRIVGCVRLETHGNKLYLGMFAVDPSIQNMGIGKEILFAAEAEARKKNCKSIDMVVISERTELIDWYKRKGYRETGEKKPMILDDPSMGILKRKLYFVTLEKQLN